MQVPVQLLGVGKVMPCPSTVATKARIPLDGVHLLYLMVPEQWGIVAVAIQKTDAHWENLTVRKAEEALELTETMLFA